MAIQNVALIGASGTLGPSILHALKASEFTPFVLVRHTSKSVYPKTRVITIPDDLNVSALTSLFRENAIDALVIAIAGSYVEEQKKLIEAAYHSGVKRVIPAEFGSCDSADEKTVKLLPLMEGKKRVREYLQSFEVKERDGERGYLTWTSLVTGHFFDWGLDTGFLKFDIPERKAYILDGGEVKFSASTLGFIAKAVVKVLEKEDETRNKLFYVHSHYVTQNEVTDVLDRVVGEKFERIPQFAQKQIDEARPKMLDGDHEAREEVVAVHGIVASDWDGKEGFANGLLGLELQSLEEAIRAVTKKSPK